VAECDDGQVIYLLWRKSTKRENLSIIVGMLKIGRKKLYIRDMRERSYELTPICILDFYVHETLQRQGHGHHLYDFMLKSETVEPGQVAIDKPSDSLLQFMSKHYGLTDPCWQNNNYVVYPVFFDANQLSIVEDKSNGYADSHHHHYASSAKHPISSSPAPTSMPPPTRFERGQLQQHQLPQQASSICSTTPSMPALRNTTGGSGGQPPGTPHRPSAAGIIHGDEPIPERRIAGSDTPQGMKNIRDFGHQSIWLGHQTLW
jgi:hypothetical protein